MKVQLTDLFPRLWPLARDEVERVFTPAHVDIAEGARADLALFLRRPVLGPTALFRYLGHRERCPRRYPILWDAPVEWRLRTAGAPLLSDGRMDEGLRGGGVMTAALPRDVRVLLRPLEGRALALPDMRACHPSILGVLSQDDALLAAAKDGHLADGVDSRLVVAGGAKTLCQALVAGGGVQAVATIAAEAGIIDVDCAGEVERFWGRFPIARAYLHGIVTEIERGAAAGAGFSVSFGAWVPVRYSGRVRFQTARQGDVTARSYVIGAWTSILRAAEAALLDSMMAAWQLEGAGAVLPLYDGVLLSIPADLEPSKLAQVGEHVAEHAGIPVRVTLRGAS